MWLLYLYRCFAFKIVISQSDVCNGAGSTAFNGAFPKVISTERICHRIKGADGQQPPKEASTYGKFYPEGENALHPFFTKFMTQILNQHDFGC